MEKVVLSCDLCDEEFPQSGRKWEYSLHIKAAKERHFYGMKEYEGRDVDFCDKCRDFMRGLLGSNMEVYKEFRKAYEIIGRMCPADKMDFASKLKEMAKEQDRYYKSHPIKEKTE